MEENRSEISLKVVAGLLGVLFLASTIYAVTLYQDKKKTETQKLRYEINQLKSEIKEIKSMIKELKASLSK